ncbi:MAG: FtsX-like permease family protein, partial [Proteobacteria bacterium]|nr:FtsX-like permease family protein [Pseudomonadota bacterium]
RIGVNVLGRDIEAEIASLRVIDWTGLGLNFVLIFSPGLLEAAPQIHIATVEIAPGAGSRTRAEVEDELERAVTDRFANVSAIRVRDALDAVLGIMGHVALAVHAAAAVALLAGIVVLGGALAAGQHLRIYDAVVLKVLGATRGRLLRVYLMEYGFLGLATAALAAVIGTLAAYLVVTKLLHLGFSFLAGPVAAVTLPGVAVTLGLGFLGTWRALDRKAAPLLRNQ